MPVNHTVVVAVDACAGKLSIEKVAVGVALFCVALYLDPLAANIKSVGHVPVISNLRIRGVRCGPALPGVHNKREAEDKNERNDHWEQSAALKANFLAFALLREPGGFFGG